MDKTEIWDRHIVKERRVPIVLVHHQTFSLIHLLSLLTLIIDHNSLGIIMPYVPSNAINLTCS